METIFIAAVASSSLTLFAYATFRYLASKHESTRGKGEETRSPATVDDVRKKKSSLEKINYSINLRISLMEENSARPGFSPGNPMDNPIIAESETLASEAGMGSRI